MVMSVNADSGVQREATVFVGQRLLGRKPRKRPGPTKLSCPQPSPQARTKRWGKNGAFKVSVKGLADAGQRALRVARVVKRGFSMHKAQTVVSSGFVVED